MFILTSVHLTMHRSVWYPDWRRWDRWRRWRRWRMARGRGEASRGVWNRKCAIHRGAMQYPQHSSSTAQYLKPVKNRSQRKVQYHPHIVMQYPTHQYGLVQYITHQYSAVKHCVGIFTKGAQFVARRAQCLSQTALLPRGSERNRHCVRRTSERRA